MPLYIDAIPNRLSKGNLLRWLLDTGEVKRQQVGSIEIRGRQAIIEVPGPSGLRLAKGLDGQALSGRTVQVWFEAADLKADPDGHFQQLARWLDMEARAESEQAQEWQRIDEKGDSSTRLTDLVVRGEDTGLGGFILLSLGPRNAMRALPATRLSVGSPVQLATQDQADAERRRGVVTGLEKNRIEVAVGKPLSSDTENPLLRVEAADDETALRRARVALARASHAQGDRLSELRAVLLGQRDPQFEDPGPLKFQDQQLDASQREAIAFGLSARDVSILHGPPGTGKTTTLVELIRQAVRRGDKVLACAPSNLGVDNLFERLLGWGESAVRIGHPVRVLPHLRDRTLNAMARSHRDMRQVKKLRSEAHAQFRKIDSSPRTWMDREARKVAREEAKSLLADARAVEDGIVQDILGDARIVCATNTGLDAELLGTRHFDLAVIDEACQCTEPSCWIPLLRAGRVVLAGDHCQLPPTIVSHPAAREGFNVSLQERLVELYGDRLSRPLQVQYRMHEEIMAFSSEMFYENRLEAHESVAGHRLCDLPGVKEEELTTTAVHFIDTSGARYDEEREAAGSSCLNRGEARIAVKKVRDLIACGVPPSDVAVITPYTAQVQVVRELLEDDRVEVGSIDGFQGREKEAVVISLVRSNTQKEIGFLGDTRRMNVALTRARRKLIVIGDSATISAHAFYERLLEHFDLVDAYHVVWEEE